MRPKHVLGSQRITQNTRVNLNLMLLNKTKTNYSRLLQKKEEKRKMLRAASGLRPIDSTRLFYNLILYQCLASLWLYYMNLIYYFLYMLIFYRFFLKKSSNLGFGHPRCILDHLYDQARIREYVS